MVFQRKWAVWAVGLFALAVMAGGLLAWWMLNYIAVQLPLKNQQAQVKINEPILAKANVLNPLDVMIQGQLQTQIPIDQQIQVPIKDTIRTQVSFDHEIPIQLAVNIDQQIPLEQVIHLDSKVQVKILGKEMSLPIRGDIPIHATIPVKLTMPINQKIKLKFVAPVDAKINQRLNIPLKATIDAKVPLQGVLQVPVKSQIETQVFLPDTLPVTITKSDIQFPLKDISLTTRPKQSGATVLQHAERQP